MSFKSMMAVRKARIAQMNANRLTEQGEIQASCDKEKAAIEFYEQGFRLGDRSATEMMNCAVLHMRYDELDRARELMLEAEKLPLSAKDKRQLRMYYAVLQYRMGDLDKALVLMRELGEGARDSKVYSILGQMLVDKAKETGDFSEADEFMKEAYRYDEEDAATLDNLAQLAMHKGRYEDAMEYFKRAVAIRPRQVASLYFLAKLEKNAGNDRAAKRYIERALAGFFPPLCPVRRADAEALAKELEAAENHA